MNEMNYAFIARGIRITNSFCLLSFVVGKSDRTRFSCIAIERLLLYLCKDIALIKKILKKFCQIIHCCVTTSFIHSVLYIYLIGLQHDRDNSRFNQVGKL